MTTVVVIDEADEQLREIFDWWRANRREAPTLVVDEFERCTTLLESSPDIGTGFHRTTIPGVRRLIMKTRHAVYYVHDADNAVVYVIAVWGGPKEGDRPRRAGWRCRDASAHRLRGGGGCLGRTRRPRTRTPTTPTGCEPLRAARPSGSPRSTCTGSAGTRSRRDPVAGCRRLTWVRSRVRTVLVVRRSRGGLLRGRCRGGCRVARTSKDRRRRWLTTLVVASLTSALGCIGLGTAGVISTLVALIASATVVWIPVSLRAS